MKVRKEVRFTVKEVEAMTLEAVRQAALKAIGLPQDNETLEVDVSSYGESVATIQQKPTKKETEADKVTP